MKIELKAYTQNPEILIADAASTCYDSIPKELDKARKMISSIIKSGHESCIEHASASFKISGVSRTLTHELVRHRIGFSYSLRSLRYVSEDFPKFVVPEELEGNSVALLEYDKCMKQCWESYKALMSLGYKKEIARYCLPNSCLTTIFVTADFRAWRNFLKLRCSMRALHEIRNLANMILDELIKIAPSCFEDLKKEENLLNT